MKRSFGLFAVAVLALLIATPAVFAQNMPITPEVSLLPVTEPLDVGGTVIQPGTYAIRVIPAADGRNKVQVTSRDGQKVFATVLTIPHELEPGEKIPNTTFIYFPATPDHPRALRTWFAANPPGGHGHDIVYSEGRAKALAVASNSNVVSYPENTNETNMTTSTLSVQTPQQTTETYTYTPPAPIVTESTTTTTTTTQTTTEQPMISSSTDTNEMPQTASSIPMFALLGLAAIAGAVALRFTRS